MTTAAPAERDQPLSPNSSNGDLAGERRWASGGELLASAKLSEEAIKKKENQLLGLINTNYGRIREVERELSQLQLQLKLTNGPKRSALEMLRKKIEVQNEKVLTARRNHEKLQKQVDAAAEVLAAEERVKDQLCQELNLLVQESAHAQIDKLEQLTRRLELLNKDLTTTNQDLATDGSGPSTSSPAAAAPAATGNGAAAEAAQLLLAAGVAEPRPRGDASSPTPGASTNPFLDPSQGADGTLGGDPAKATRIANKAAAVRLKQQQQKDAVAARARHVQLPVGRPLGTAAQPQPPPLPAPVAVPRRSDGEFRGFDT